MAKPALALSMALTLSLGLACVQTHGPDMTGSSLYPEGSEEVYAQALDAWSREARTFDGLATSLILKGTLKSPAFMEAYGYEEARLRLETAEERDERMAMAVASVQGEVRVLFTLQSPKHRQLRLDREAKRGEWAVRLVNGEGMSIEASAIEQVLIPNDLAPSLLFPYITRWDEAFEAVFPEAPEGGAPFLNPRGGAVTFQVAGPIGAAELSWDIPPGSAVSSIEALPSPLSQAP